MIWFDDDDMIWWWWWSVDRDVIPEIDLPNLNKRRQLLALQPLQLHGHKQLIPPAKLHLIILNINLHTKLRISQRPHVRTFNLISQPNQYLTPKLIYNLIIRFIDIIFLLFPYNTKWMIIITHYWLEIYF